VPGRWPLPCRRRTRVTRIRRWSSSAGQVATLPGTLIPRCPGCSTARRNHGTDYSDPVLDLDRFDIDEIATALADQSDYDHRWLINPLTGLSTSKTPGHAAEIFALPISGTGHAGHRPSCYLRAPPCRIECAVRDWAASKGISAGRSAGPDVLLFSSESGTSDTRLVRVPPQRR